MNKKDKAETEHACKELIFTLILMMMTMMMTMMMLMMMIMLMQQQTIDNCSNLQRLMNIFIIRIVQSQTLKQKLAYWSLFKSLLNRLSMEFKSILAPKSEQFTSLCDSLQFIFLTPFTFFYISKLVSTLSHFCTFTFTLLHFHTIHILLKSPN